MSAAETVQKIRIDYSWCKRCGICTDFCPGKVFSAEPDGTPVIAKADGCTECGLCILMCPDYALDWGGAVRRKEDRNARS